MKSLFSWWVGGRLPFACDFSFWVNFMHKHFHNFPTFFCSFFLGRIEEWRHFWLRFHEQWQRAMRQHSLSSILESFSEKSTSQWLHPCHHNSSWRIQYHHHWTSQQHQLFRWVWSIHIFICGCMHRKLKIEKPQSRAALPIIKSLKLLKFARKCLIVMDKIHIANTTVNSSFNQINIERTETKPEKWKTAVKRKKNNSARIYWLVQLLSTARGSTSATSSTCCGRRNMLQAKMQNK